ncbi:MAG: cytochrome c biogenesis protein ResB [Bacteroidaceae bacterium]|nr:cytochrome c biogenesis protein ResB [Bacteroidaceae bacterium]
MWHKPWRMKEGFAIGAGLIITGLILQFSLGPIDWSLFAWPTNIIVLGIFLLLSGIIYIFRSKVYGFRFLATSTCAVPALVMTAALTIIMGLTAQVAESSPPADYFGFTKMLSFWPFVLLYFWIVFILAQVSLVQVSHFKWRRLPSMVSHLGLLISLLTATLGSADMQRLQMYTVLEQTEWRGINERNMMIELPIAITLKQFIMETYDDGSPKRFASDIIIHTKNGDSQQATVDVNKPVEVKGWKIYQYGYDTAMGAESELSILELVRDPWLPYVYTGIYLMLFGALTMLFFGVRRNKQ